MANVTVSVPVSNISVSSTNNIVSVGTTTSNIIVSSSALLSNADVRAAISVVDAGGDGSFSYSNGVMTYTGPTQSEAEARIDAHLVGGTGITSTASGNGVTFAIAQSVATSDNVVLLPYNIVTLEAEAVFNFLLIS